MKYTGARIVIECLVEQGVDMVFGYPGGAILNVYDELYKNKDRVHHILTAHEQGAAHAADGYSRSTGKVGVVMATSGPGATNLVTGIATAYMDSIPMVAITCNVTTPLLGKDSFQEIDITGITMPITKHNYIVRDVNRLADTIREAFLVAQSGRPGPVLVDIPKDVTAAVADYNPPVVHFASEEPSSLERASIRRVTKISSPSDAEVEAIASIINESQRPFLYVGGGVVIDDACQQLRELAELRNIPVATSLMGKSAFPSRHPLCCGMIGMHGTKAANTGANRSDLVIALGARFSDRVISDSSKFARNSRILHIDVDPAEINKNIAAHYSLVGSVRELLTRLLPLIQPRTESEWNQEIAQWKQHLPAMYSKKTRLHPKFAFEYINRRLGDDTIITTEVGQHQMWAAQFYPFAKPRTFLTSGGLGTMGYGTGAAIGAQLANPDRRVVHIAGDGSFRMNCNELATIAHYQVPVIIVVVNNGTLGMVRQWQHLFYDKRYSETTLDFGPDFVKLAEAYGIAGSRATNEEEFMAAFDRAAESGKAAIIDCSMSIDEMVLPMVPAGKPIDELLLDI
ncbi:MAG: biosynthetic-type acetolactate synthase large subunit [Spirochaetaceae bacterium]|nr:biosynthetic-type acetolactate synthase large subunit [Spirochaetaceae bacterium]